jgi:Holliday junction resolvasome RuvABC ATP-dependent DNA helicase subunit
MAFIGQKKIMTELNILANEMKQGKNFNILFHGASGYGKTTLALKIVNYIDLNSAEYVLPDDAGNVVLSNKRFKVIDEAHNLRNQELLYPSMDSGKYTFLFCTNEAGELKEPLQNRCINFYLEEYTLDEMIQIAQNSITLQIPYSFYKIIAISSNGNPRVCNSICRRLFTLFSYLGTPKSEEELLSMIETTLQIKDGLNEPCQRYLTFLREAGVPVSIDLISTATKLDKATIRRDIEPTLVYRKLIQITSKGRKAI